MVPTPPAGVPTSPATEIEGLFLQLGAAERAKIFAPAPIDRSTVVDSVYSTSQTYEVLERTADNSWLRQVTMMFGADGEPNTADDSIEAYTIYPYGQLGVAYSFIHPGPDAIWFTEDDVAGVHYLGKVVYFPNGALLEYEGASEGAVLIIPCLDPGTDGLPFSADDKPGCSLGYQVAVLDGADNRGQVVTYDAAGPDGLWFTADDRVKNYTLVTYNGTGVGVASVLYNGDGADNIWFTADDDVQLHTLTKLGDDFKPRYTATYNNRGVDSTWFTADDVVQSWTYYGYDANGNNILVATHASKGSDGIWFTADDSATATISLKDDNGYPMLSGQITSGGMGPDGRWLSGDETLFGYTYNEYNDAGLQTRTVTMQSSGPDGKWFTADDQPGLYGNYWIRELTPDNRIQKQIYFDASLSPGARAFSDVHRSRYTVYSPDFSTSVSVYRDQYGSSFGADGEPFTEDDIIGWPYSVTTPTGLDQFNQPGPDGTWFTADDVRSNYVVYSYDGLRRTEQRFDANDSIISYTEIVPISASSYRLNSYALDEFDALVLSSYSIIDEDINGYPLVTTYYDLSDMITNVEYTERDADGNIIRQGWSYSPGNDGIWATSDDYSYYALYFFNMSGEQIASGMERVGPDGIWGTEDDTISIDSISQLEYDLDVLALNGGVNADTCGTLLSGLGASGDINLLVRDQNGAPLSGVVAQLGPNGATVTTDGNGEAAFVGLSGTQDVHLFKDGYAWESFYCVAPGLDVTLASTLSSLTVAAEESKVSFYIEPTNKNVTLRLLDAQGKSVAARSLSTSSGAEAGTTYGDLLFNLPAGTEVSGELWVFEVDYSSGRLVSAQSLGQQTYTTIPWNSYPSVQDREQITVSLPTSDLVPVAFDGSLVRPHGVGFGTFGVSLDDLFVLPFNYESALGDSAAMAPGVDVTLPATAQPTAVVAYTSLWTARYPGVFPEIANGTFVASIITGFQYGP
ncbi:MAG: hypothetical protein KDH99_01865, partial [Alcanivoracaceae bacterium]|nr:hypothetical protein [Alcanivoracaceae bacterium]